MNENMVIPAILIIAFLYSSVGHGGASGYLVIMTLAGFSLPAVRASALLLNMVVAGIAFLSFYRSHLYRLRKLVPFLLGSVPATFLGSQIVINTNVYRIMLAIIIFIAVMRLLLKFREAPSPLKKIPPAAAVIAGIWIGFISGLIGIGGGILLSPLLLLFRWSEVKETACLSALFIFINSFTGISGLLLHHNELQIDLLPFILSAMTGGWLGSWIGSRHFPITTLRLTLVLVLLVAGVKLLAG